MALTQNAAHDHAASTWLPEPEHSGELIRLERLLEGAAGRFALILVGYNQPGYRDQLIRHLRSSRTADGPAVLDANTMENLPQLEDWLESHSAENAPLHLVGLERWLAHDEKRPEGLERLRGFNRHRDHIAKRCRRPLLLWLLQHQLGEFALVAPDAWEWRAGVLDFGLRQQPSALELPQHLDSFAADRQQRLERIAELERFLREHDDRLDDRERLVLWEELGDLNKSIGEWNAALDAYAQADAACRRLDDRLDAARLFTKIAEIHWRRGEPDTALTELRRAQAVFETLGDERSRALTLGKIAYILQDQGELEAALRIRREEALPVYERLGDVRERAVTLGKIADILQARGELDEALRTLQDEVFPAFERLGDVRSRAVTLGQIADILQARGELDEALRIRREEELPVYERLGDMRSLLVGRTNLALLLLQRTPPERAEAERLLRLALVDARRLRLPEAGRIEAIMARVGFAVPASG